MEFRILGPLEVRDGERVPALGGARRRAVLGLLLLDANRVVSVDGLVDGVWGDAPPASAHASLQNHVSRLRDVLGDRLVTRAPGYLLRVGRDELDLDRFRHLVDEAHGAEAAVAAQRLREALSLWRGAPLADLAGEPAGLAAAHLDELRLAALETRVEADLALGRHTALVPELEELVRLEPYREQLRGQLILALYRSGRQADALEAYAAARRFLDDVGAQPGRELRELHRAVLQQDASLDRPAGAATPPVSRRRAEERRTVTVLAADVLLEPSPEDPEARRAALRERSGLVERELESHGAAVEVLGGGGVLGVFGVPTAQDDDSLRAVRAAFVLGAAQLTSRVALATGEVVTGDPFVAGAPVEHALGLRDIAAPGEVLAEARSWRLVRHAVAASLRDDGAWVIESIDADAAPLALHLETPLVGRARELEQIADDFERAAGEGRPHLVTIFGAPGIGKTRLAVECVQRLRAAATPVFARCRAGEEASTYAPLREVLEGLADGELETWIRARLEPELAAWLTAAIGVGAEPGRPEETAWAARRLLAGLADDLPLLVVLDDVHWAAPALLDLVESLVELASAPVLVLCLARPDLLDVRPQWGGGRLSSSSVLLDALTEAESDALLDRLTAAKVDPAGRERIVSVAEGNPLFIEQLLMAALEGDAEAVPDSIQTLLAARLDRLDDRDRGVAQAAAVCGTSFTTEDVAELVEADPSASLLTLVRRELVRPGEADDPGGAGWSFRHSLIRDVAYGTLTKRRRAELHERLAGRAIERGGEVDLQAGYHLDRAVGARREAGEQGAAVDALAVRTGEHLARAGVAAYERDDLAAAASLLARATALLPRESLERLELLPKLAAALIYRGEVAGAQAMLAEGYTTAVELGDARLAARVRLSAGLALLWTEAAVPPERMLLDIDEAVPLLEQADDYEGLAMAEMLRFHALDRAGFLAAPAVRFPLAMEYARRANARHLEHYVMGWVCITLPRGELPVDEAITRATEILDASTSTYTRASALGALGLLRAMKGEFDDARALVEEDRRMLEELGARHDVAAHAIAVSEVEAMAGDDAAAERILRTGLEAVTTFGDEHSATNAAWRLGLALARQGRYDEAEPFVRVAQRSGHRGFWVDLWWRVVLALIEANRGNALRASELVDEVTARLASVDESGFHADALLECADALRAAGHEEEATTLLFEAARIAQRLGYVVAQRRAEQAQRTLTA